jgi:hypothetical protein
VLIGGRRCVPGIREPIERCVPLTEGHRRSRQRPVHLLVIVLGRASRGNAVAEHSTSDEAGGSDTKPLDEFTSFPRL